jgi:hypothetical protein
MVHALARPVMLVAMLMVAFAPSGSARTIRTNFDGEWSVLIITDSGPCGQTYRYGLRIAAGQFYYEGGMGAALSGRVDRSGNVRVSLRQGDSVAQGTGRLSRSAGAGRWQGTSPSGRCSGRWQAERRG